MGKHTSIGAGKLWLIFLLATSLCYSNSECQAQNFNVSWPVGSPVIASGNVTPYDLSWGPGVVFVRIFMNDLLFNNLYGTKVNPDDYFEFKVKPLPGNYAIVRDIDIPIYHGLSYYQFWITVRWSKDPSFQSYTTLLDNYKMFLGQINLRYSDLNIRLEDNETFYFRIYVYGGYSNDPYFRIRGGNISGETFPDCLQPFITSSDEFICPGEISYQLQAGPPGGTFSSTEGLGLNPATGEIHPAASVPGTYQVSYTLPADESCPERTAVTTVTINPPPDYFILEPAVPVYMNSDAVFYGPERLNCTYEWSVSGSGSIEGSNTQQQVTVRAGDICGGYYILTLKVTDQFGCTTTYSRDFIAEDHIPPVVNATGTKTIYLDEKGSATLSAADVEDGSTDNCGIASMDVSPPSFSCKDLGDNPVILTVYDASWNVASATTIVMVQDNLPPTAKAKGISVQLDENGIATITADQVDDGSADNCGIASMEVLPSSFSCKDLGDNLVTLTAKDASGNIASATATITVLDNLPPKALAKSIQVPLDKDGVATINADQVNDGSSDNCGIASMEVLPSSFTCENRGENTVTLTVKDAQGNEASATAIITVIDDLPPTAVAKNIPVYLDENGMATITADQVNDGSSDNCGIDVMEVSPDIFSSKYLGDNPIIFTVKDASGNVSSTTAIVKVYDNLPPVVRTTKALVYLDENGLATITANQVDRASYDNCRIASMEVLPSSFTCENLGENTVALIVRDVSGNVASATTIVNVYDNLPPVARAKNIQVTLDENGIAKITADQVDEGSSDNCGIYFMEVSPSTFSCENLGDNLVTLTVKDDSWNSASTTAIVTVIDNLPPAAKAKGIPVYLDENGLASLSADDVNDGSSDNCSIASMEVIPSSFTCENLGDNLVTLTIKDASGNVASASATITVLDKLPPKALAKSIPVTLDENGLATITPDQVNDGSSDNCGITSMEVLPSSFSCKDLGDNLVTFTIKDASGNSALATATVTVIDNLPPIAKAKGIPVYLDENGLAIITAAQVDDGSSDNCGIDVIEISPSSFSCKDLGDNQVTLIVKDASGNSASATAIVTVNDDLPPTARAKNIPVILDENGLATITPDQVDDGSSDNCGINFMSLSKSTFTCEDKGENRVIFTVRDAEGNESTAEAVITVEGSLPSILGEIQAPVDPIQVGIPISLHASFTCTGLKNISWYCSSDGQNFTAYAPSAVDPVAGTVDGNVTLPVGIYTICLLVEDVCGQKAEQFHRYVVVFDPNGGFVTGGGWINSPEGAFTANQNLTGKASFGFVAKYKKGSTAVEGNTEFQFQAGNLNFKSQLHETGSLVISGGKATYRGTGTVNGVPGYKFMVTGIDGNWNNGIDPDRFRIKITDENGPVYDNGLGAEENSLASTTLAGGSIVIHEVKRKSGYIELAEVPAIRVYPNPFSEEVHFELLSPADTEATIEIYDISGRKINILFEGIVKGGVAVRATFHPESMISGFYYYRVKLGDSVSNGKLVYSK